MRKLGLSQEWKVAFKNFNLTKILGFGSYGKVVHAICKVSNQPVAIKFIQGIFKNEYDCVKILREISIQAYLSAISNQHHIVELIDVFTTEHDINDPKFGLFIVMEYVESDLRKMLT